MNFEVKQRWVAALRSGEYKQGKGTLKMTSEFTGEAKHCCLGVLCEIALTEGITTEQRRMSNVGVSHFNGASAYPPHEVVEWAGLGTNKPEVKVLGGDGFLPVALDLLNDSGTDFSRIADLIEENL